MNTTIWITPQGQVVNCPPNEHYAYMAQRYEREFGHKPINESAIHDDPYHAGWVHIQNYHNAFNVRGNPQAIRNRGGQLRNMIFDRLMEDRNFVVNIEYNNKAMINQFGESYRFSMPDQFEDLRRIL